MTAMSQEFCRVVCLLRQLPEQYRVMALHAAMFWSDERLLEADANGDLPGNPGELAEPKTTAIVLKLVVNEP
jgi:hypothetical protein